MTLRVSFLEIRKTHLSVDLRRLERRVPELLLDLADVGAVLQHVGRAGVAKQVAAAGLLDAGLQDQALDQGVLQAPRPSPVVEKEKRLGAFGGGELGAGLLDTA